MSVGQYGIPGQGQTVRSQDREIMWGNPQERQVLLGGGVIDSTARDGASTRLRRGLLLGRVTATKKLREWDSGASDGSETLYGVLNVELELLELGQATERYAPVVVQAPLKTEHLLIQGTPLLDHADSAAAITALQAKGCALDSELL